MSIQADSAPSARPGHERGPRLVAVNRFYWPDQSATSQLLTDLAEHLAARGGEVAIVTSRQSYEDPMARLPARQTQAGVAIHRVWTSRFGRHWLPGRAVDYLSFYLAALIMLLRLVRPGDTILAKTDPPLISVGAWVVARLRRATLVTWCQDLFPEVAAVLGLRWAEGPVGRALAALRDRSLRAARLNVVLCRPMADRLLAAGVPAQHIAIVDNWADGRLVRPVAPEDNPLRRAWGLEGRRVIGYSGNLGRAHDLPAVQACITALGAADPAIVFLFIGGGAGMTALARWVAARKLANVQFRPYQPRERLALSLSVPDLHLVSLAPACEGLIMPSKIYGILAAGRPILALGDPQGAMAELVRAHDLGLVWAPGRERAVGELLARAGQAEYRRHIRAVFERRFERVHALRHWERLLRRGPEAVDQAAPWREHAARPVADA